MSRFALGFGSVVSLIAIGASSANAYTPRVEPTAVGTASVWIAPPAEPKLETEVIDPTPSPGETRPVLLPLPPEGWAGLSVVLSMVAAQSRRRARRR